MARACATSVLAPLVISAAVDFTMPSVGRNLLGWRKCCRFARVSFGELPGAEVSTATFLVAMRLVTARSGLTPAGDSAATKLRESDWLSTNLAAPPSALNLLERVFWKGVGWINAPGTQMRVVPEDFRTSTRVVTSKVRQLSGPGASANRRPVFENAKLADRALAVRRKSRRFISFTSVIHLGHSPWWP